VLEISPIEVVDGRTTVPVKVGEAMFAGVYPILATATPEASFGAVIDPLAMLRLAGVWTMSQDVPLNVQALPLDSK
jgi:hypothetical protein